MEQNQTMQTSQVESALITGASQGIGFACAQWLAQQGCQKLILTGRNLASLQQAKSQIETHHPPCEVTIYTCDHSQLEHVMALAQRLEQSDNLPKAVIANVGVNPVHELGPKSVVHTSVPLLLDTFQTNVANTHALLTPFLKHFKRNGGRIVLVGSQAYQYGVKGQLAYNLSKAALVGYQNTLANEFAKREVFCHLVNPGVVKNARTEKLRANVANLEAVSEANVAQSICDVLHQTDNKNLVINI
ncbi:SDR family NAD(P)-dependent oxidoreductase [Alteromonas sp. a30]|uniref:SDR family NAD(P)-dependent oxidoreductase n=1 Tax=Alteromonas sp. a30 TaxID=2730917 RepID=UPI002282D013|nr:SDR family oxidoreductase [Alteromonas sp. a30]MCY7297226.1 SDR family oxidoreductase [Alteromonas sp. a30]